MLEFDFIRRERCSLCDLAERMLLEVGAEPGLVLYVDDDAALESEFGWKVPVLRARGRAPLCWPFDAWSLRRFLDS